MVLVLQPSGDSTNATKCHTGECVNLAAVLKFVFLLVYVIAGITTTSFYRVKGQRKS